LAFVASCHYVPGEQSPAREIAVAESIPPVYQANADAWNAVFQKQPGDAYGWSGGDAAISVRLPYCETCPVESRYRRIWFFGDSTFSLVDDKGARIRQNDVRGADFAFGNVAAITEHAAENTTTTNAVNFDYGAKGYKSNAWMPLLIDPMQLPDLDDLRVAAQGYEGMGFVRETNAVASVYSLSTQVPAPLRDDAVPVYEFVCRECDASDYRLVQNDRADGFVFERIAFFVLRHQLPGTVALFRFTNAAEGEVAFATQQAPLPDFAASADKELLGYVYPASTVATASAATTNALVAYQRHDPQSGHTHRIYTTRPNDRGKSVFMWPNHGVIIGNDLIQIYTPVTPSILPGMVSWDEVDENVVAIVRGVNRPYSQWGKAVHGNWQTVPLQRVLAHSNAQISWGHFAFKDRNYERNGLLYVYGLRDRNLLVARLVCRSADDYLDFSRWQFYSDGDWVASSSAATPIAHDVSNDFSITPTPSGRYLLVHANSMLGPKIALQGAASPIGPFAGKVSIDLASYKNERDRAQRYSYYAASVHESLSHGGADGGVMISYVRSCAFSRDPACSGADADDIRADVYVPRFINIPWHVLEGVDQH